MRGGRGSPESKTPIPVDRDVRGPEAASSM